MPVTNREDSPSATVDRVVSILSVFPGARSLTSAQIAHRTGVPRSSVHRLLQRLVELGVVERNGFEYRVGLRLFELGSAALDRHSIHRVALPFMNRLSRATGTSVYLGTLSGADIVYTEGIWTDWAGSRRLGVSHPAHLTASGKMLLACLPDDERPALDFTATPTRTPHSITSRQALERELHEIRERGVAVNRGEVVAGSVSYAVQIGPPELASTALSIWGPVECVRPAEMIGHLRQTGRAIWEASRDGSVRRHDERVAARTRTAARAGELRVAAGL
ncbi:IclR family transcriptional regulator [Rhodococcus aetherivorans]|uniref:IclR family transcriptional regulator n=1 Tax=Rhodococcus aetherivorans TaxID=191292 RepID=UPI00045CD94C|nr:IclR family transcriptional regulator [Rhodococcus aetherivorans]KDE12214.1 hypothetical protein N505_0118120 [Rhodococcus aetherivorans]